MPWLLALHIIALVCWCGSLLYLPALTAVSAVRASIAMQVKAKMTRLVYTLVATPAALLAVASGTALFFTKHLVAGWLVAKLTLVSGLVICHMANGWLILYLEHQPRKYGTLLCALVGIGAAVLMVGIIWLVLAKPF